MSSVGDMRDRVACTIANLAFNFIATREYRDKLRAVIAIGLEVAAKGSNHES